MQSETSTAYPRVSKTPTSTTKVSRRSFPTDATVTTILSGVPGALAAQQGVDCRHSPPSARADFRDFIRFPDKVTIYSRLTDPVPLTRSQSEWRGNENDAKSVIRTRELAIHVRSPGMSVRYIHLRWEVLVATRLHVLGHHLERSYDDLGWRNIIPERVIPRYFATDDGCACSYGVKTAPSSLCFWQLDPEGGSLWLNLSNEAGVQLGQRILTSALIVTRKGTAGEEPMHALREFCRQVCSRPTPAS